MTLIRCPQGRAKTASSRSMTAARWPSMSSTSRSPRRTGTTRIILLTTARACSGACRWARSSSTAGAAGSTRSKTPTGWCSTSTPTRGWGSTRCGRPPCACARCSRDLGLETFPMLTGGKGIHVVAPLDQTRDWPAVKGFAERFSRAIAEAEPQRFTANIRKIQRKGRIFLDWLRNQRGATAVMPYSARAREGAPVAAPVAWRNWRNRARPTSTRSATRRRSSRAPTARRWRGVGPGQAGAAGRVSAQPETLKRR